MNSALGTPAEMAAFSFYFAAAEPEYTVTIAGYDHQNFIPERLSVRLGEVLGPTWWVSNRGSRLEVVSQLDERPRDDTVITTALEQLLCNSRPAAPSTLMQSEEAYAAGSCPYRVQYANSKFWCGYQVNVGSPGSTEDIPYRIAPELEVLLGDNWEVHDRGSRIEITSLRPDRPRDDEAILSALAEIYCYDVSWV